MKPLLLFSVVMLLIALIGSIAVQRVFKPMERQLAQKESLQRIKSMSATERMRYYESVYEDIKSSFIPFDLANGLTFEDIKAIRSNFHQVFYLLIACLFLARLLKKPRA